MKNILEGIDKYRGVILLTQWKNTVSDICLKDNTLLQKKSLKVVLKDLYDTYLATHSFRELGIII